MSTNLYLAYLGFDPQECVSKYLLHHPAQTSAPRPVVKPKWLTSYEARRDAFYAAGLTAQGKPRTGRWHRRPELAGLDSTSSQYHTEYLRLVRKEQRQKYNQIFY